MRPCWMGAGVALLASWASGCGGSDDEGGAGTEPGRVPIEATGGQSGDPPASNPYSWDGSFMPTEADFPLDGLLDDQYPELPPGDWDWEDSEQANWRNFESNLGSFEPLVDDDGNQYGWRLVFEGESLDYSGPASYFEGSSGTDILNLGPDGAIHSFAGSLGDGPDVLVFNRSYSLHFLTGSSLAGALRDNDLVVAGCDENLGSDFDIQTTTIHTGPGADRVFIRDLDRAAVDLGNGAGGRTDTLDPTDGADLVVLRGNTHDFRVFGGAGSDVAIWFVDDNVQATEWLGPNFFGDGGKGDALWGDPANVDRLVMAVPASTELVVETPTPAGALLVRASDGEFIDDAPTANDPLASYCGECGIGPDGQKTVIMEYRSLDESVFTGYFFVTAFEELQVGLGDGARVYRIDSTDGTATLAEDLTPVDAPPFPAELCQPG